MSDNDPRFGQRLHGVAQDLSQGSTKLPAMKTLELYRWWVTDPESGRRHATRHRMTREDALQVDPCAQVVAGSLELRDVMEDVWTVSTSSWQRSTRGQDDPR